MSHGAYIVSAESDIAAASTPFARQLNAETDAQWLVLKMPDAKGKFLMVHPGCGMSVSDYGQAMQSEYGEGIQYLAPKNPHKIYMSGYAKDIDGIDIATVNLRRYRNCKVMLGTGPCYAVGPLAGQPSSEYGQCAAELYQRATDEGREWTQADEALALKVVVLALQQTHNIERDLIYVLSPWDADESKDVLRATWGCQDPQ